MMGFDGCYVPSLLRLQYSESVADDNLKFDQSDSTGGEDSWVFTEIRRWFSLQELRSPWWKNTGDWRQSIGRLRRIEHYCSLKPLCPWWFQWRKFVWRRNNLFRFKSSPISIRLDDGEQTVAFDKTSCNILGTFYRLGIDKTTRPISIDTGDKCR